MKESHKKMLDSAIKALNVFGVENKDIMVLGSIALDIVGLFPLNRHIAHDVDLMIRCDSTIEDKIRCMSKIMNVVDSSNIKNTSYNQSIILNVSNVSINIWFVSKDYQFDTILKLDNGVFVEKPIDCIKKKKSYHRVKDYEDIRNIIFQIL